MINNNHIERRLLDSKFQSESRHRLVQVRLRRAALRSHWRMAMKHRLIRHESQLKIIPASQSRVIYDRPVEDHLLQHLRKL